MQKKRKRKKNCIVHFTPIWVSLPPSDEYSFRVSGSRKECIKLDMMINAYNTSEAQTG